MKIKIGKRYLIFLILFVLLAIGYFSITGMFVQTEEEVKVIAKTIGEFQVTNQKVCKENGKPIIYFFGHSSCPHCLWQHPILLEVVNKFQGLISFHDNMDSKKDSDVFESYKNINPGYVPFLVFGCKYVRIGSGERAGKEEESKALTAITCKLTNSLPEEVCVPLSDMIKQIP